MKKSFSILLLIFMGFNVIYAQGSLNASEVLNRAVKKLSSANGIEAKFLIKNAGLNGEGTIKTMGSKYHVALPDIEVWYNGKTMYTYNKRTEETTVVTPTTEEISETNPLSYISNSEKNYTAVFAKEKKSGKYVLDLLPKSKKDNIKKVVLTLKQNDFTPENMVVEPLSGSPITIDIKTFKTAVSGSTSEFEYPKSKYPGVEIIDLR